MGETAVEPNRHLDRDPASLHLVRQWLTDELRARTELDRSGVDDAVVMASELITNVLAHTDADYRIRLIDQGERLRIEVEDPSPGVPVMRERDPGRVGGNGLRIVDAWSDDWGVTPLDGGGKVVWFTIRRS